MNIMSKDSKYSVNEDLGDGPNSTPNGDSLGPSDNDSDGLDVGRNLGVNNPNDPCAFDSDDDGDIHMWSNIAEQEFLSSSNMHTNT